MSRRAGAPTSYILGFLVLALITLGGNWRLDVMRRTGRNAASAINNGLRLAEQGLADLRGAQAGYLAAGQNAEEWMNKATAISSQLENAIANLNATTISAGARAHYEAAAAVTTELAASDRRARELVATGQTFVASDILFQEAVEPAKRLSTELTAARDIEMAAFELTAARLGWIGLGANGLALAIGLVLFILGSRVQAGRGAEVLAEQPNQAQNPGTPEPRNPGTSSDSLVNDPFPAIDLSGAAELCVDLGRVADGRALPGLMTRAAAVLEAKGLVLWVIESGGTVLRPSIAHGYSDRALQRMGTLPADGDNVTSLAFRTLQPQVIRGSFEGHGALAVPLITANGCVGVLAAEVQGAKLSDARFAIARMIAAQLSTLVSPGATTPASKAAEA